MNLFETIIQDFSELKQDKKALRDFGLLTGAILIGFGLFGGWKNDWQFTDLQFILCAIGAVWMLAGIVLPQSLKRLHSIWMIFAFILGFFMTKIILGIVYYLLITPISFLMKLVGRDVLSRKIDPEAESYWIKKNLVEDKKEHLERFF